MGWSCRKYVLAVLLRWIPIVNCTSRVTVICAVQPPISHPGYQQNNLKGPKRHKYIPSFLLTTNWLSQRFPKTKLLEYFNATLVMIRYSSSSTKGDVCKWKLDFSPLQGGYRNTPWEVVHVVSKCESQAQYKAWVEHSEVFSYYNVWPIRYVGTLRAVPACSLVFNNTELLIWFEVLLAIGQQYFQQKKSGGQWNLFMIFCVAAPY